MSTQLNLFTRELVYTPTPNNSRSGQMELISQEVKFTPPEKQESPDGKSAGAGPGQWD
jgi:hypothetical protein